MICTKKRAFPGLPPFASAHSPHRREAVGCGELLRRGSTPAHTEALPVKLHFQNRAILRYTCIAP